MSRRKDRSRGRTLVLTAALLSACSLAPADETIREGVLEQSGRQGAGRTRTANVDASDERAQAAWIRRNENRTFDAYIYRISGTVAGKAGIANYENMEVWVYDAELGDLLRLKYDPPKSGRERKRIFATAVQKLGSARTPIRGEIRPGQTYEVTIIGVTAANDRYGLLGDELVYIAGAPGIGLSCKIRVIGSGSDIAASSGGSAWYARAI